MRSSLEGIRLDGREHGAAVASLRRPASLTLREARPRRWLMQVSADAPEPMYEETRDRGMCRSHLALRTIRHEDVDVTQMLLVAAALAASVSLQACNTTAGIGMDVSAGSDAVTDSAESNKNTELRNDRLEAFARQVSPLLQSTARPLEGAARRRRERQGPERNREHERYAVWKSAPCHIICSNPPRKARYWKGCRCSSWLMFELVGAQPGTRRQRGLRPKRSAILGRGGARGLDDHRPDANRMKQRSARASRSISA